MQFSTGQNLIKFGADTLTIPELVFGNSKKIVPREASWNLNEIKFITPKPIGQIHILNLNNAIRYDRNSPNRLQTF